LSVDIFVASSEPCALQKAISILAEEKPAIEDGSYRSKDHAIDKEQPGGLGRTPMTKVVIEVEAEHVAGSEHDRGDQGRCNTGGPPSETVHDEDVCKRSDDAPHSEATDGKPERPLNQVTAGKENETEYHQDSEFTHERDEQRHVKRP
jgi:hypothetical protein